ncbi:hypothetical protein ACFL2E_06815 [Thermodesulfobacteriota bacterium]
MAKNGHTSPLAPHHNIFKKGAVHAEHEEKCVISNGMLYHYFRVSDAIVSSLFISTRNVLSGIQEKDKWTDVVTLGDVLD